MNITDKPIAKLRLIDYNKSQYSARSQEPLAITV